MIILCICNVLNRNFLEKFYSLQMWMILQNSVNIKLLKFRLQSLIFHNSRKSEAKLSKYLSVSTLFRLCLFCLYSAKASSNWSSILDGLFDSGLGVPESSVIIGAIYELCLVCLTPCVTLCRSCEGLVTGLCDRKDGCRGSYPCPRVFISSGLYKVLKTPPSWCRWVTSSMRWTPPLWWWTRGCSCGEEDEFEWLKLELSSSGSLMSDNGLESREPREGVGVGDREWGWDVWDVWDHTPTRGVLQRVTCGVLHLVTNDSTPSISSLSFVINCIHSYILFMPIRSSTRNNVDTLKVFGWQFLHILNTSDSLSESVLNFLLVVTSNLGIHDWSDKCLANCLQEADISGSDTSHTSRSAVILMMTPVTCHFLSLVWLLIN